MKWQDYDHILQWWGFRAGPLRSHDAHERRLRLGANASWGSQLRQVTGPIMRTIAGRNIEVIGEDYLDKGILAAPEDLKKARLFLQTFFNENPGVKDLLSALQGELLAEGARGLAHLIDLVFLVGG